MRALRDFNTPKIVTDDVPIFMGLIGDLFPALNVPRKRDPDFEAMVKKSVVVSRIKSSASCYTVQMTVAWMSCVHTRGVFYSVGNESWESLLL